MLTCGKYLYDIKYIEGYPLILGTAGNATVIELTAVATIGADASSIVLTVRTLFFFFFKEKNKQINEDIDQLSMQGCTLLYFLMYVDVRIYDVKSHQRLATPLQTSSQ